MKDCGQGAETYDGAMACEGVPAFRFLKAYLGRAAPLAEPCKQGLHIAPSTTGSKDSKKLDHQMVRLYTGKRVTAEVAGPREPYLRLA